jgi:hypothetical protein
LVAEQALLHSILLQPYAASTDQTVVCLKPAGATSRICQLLSPVLLQPINVVSLEPARATSSRTHQQLQLYEAPADSCTAVSLEPARATSSRTRRRGCIRVTVYRPNTLQKRTLPGEFLEISAMLPCIRGVNPTLNDMKVLIRATLICVRRVSPTRIYHLMKEYLKDPVLRFMDAHLYLYMDDFYKN